MRTIQIISIGDKCNIIEQHSLAAEVLFCLLKGDIWRRQWNFVEIFTVLESMNNIVLRLCFAKFTFQIFQNRLNWSRVCRHW